MLKQPDRKYRASAPIGLKDRTWPDAVLTQHVQAVAGFSWGFNVTQSDINFATPRILGVNDWNGHLSLLRGAYPTWKFAEGLIG